MYQQLITPNYNIAYVGGLCEGFVEGTVGQATIPTLTNQTTLGVYGSAERAWEANNGNHTERPPTGVCIPLFFRLGSTIDGHVALLLPDGRIASSTQSGFHTTAYIHPNLEDLITVYSKVNNGCTYLGWSEYIGKLKVVGDTMTQDAVEKLVSMAYRAATDVDPTNEQAGYWVQRIKEDPNRAYELVSALGGATYRGDPSFRTKAINYDADVKASYDKGKADGGGGDFQPTTVYTKVTK